jgi:hypothetical protein
MLDVNDSMRKDLHWLVLSEILSGFNDLGGGVRLKRQRKAAYLTMDRKQGRGRYTL